MPRSPKRKDPESLRVELIQLFVEFENRLKQDDLREKVLQLVSAYHKMRDLGSSLIPLNEEVKGAAKDRILFYFRKYVGQVLHSEEFLVVSGIQEYARRIRELRVQEGWPILSGQTIKDMLDAEELADQSIEDLKVDTYVLLKDEQDREAAYRWNLANSIRKENWGLKKKFLEFFIKNVSKPVTGEELSYLAKGAAGWPRRIRELRTEEGWAIRTKNTGRPDLPIGAYILEDLRQGKVHDRNIPDSILVKVLERDNYRCKKCGWSIDQKTIGDPRHLLEVHHIKFHSKGGLNIEENLATLCNVHHDEIHRLDRHNEWGIEEFIEWVNA